MATYFTSDLHFGHASVIKMAKRPFASVEDMDSTLIENWNSKVKNGDTVYILGDVSVHAPPDRYLRELNGRKILVIGNHDHSWADTEEYDVFFQSKMLMADIYINNCNVTLCHYPLLEWRGSRKRRSKKLGYLIHGHIHNRYSEEYRQLFMQENALNAGADVNNFQPVTFGELKENNLHFKFNFLLSVVDKAILLSRTFHNSNGEAFGTDNEKALLETVDALDSNQAKVELLLSDIKNEIGQSAQLQNMVDELLTQL